jgi:hypothetical protein
LYSPIEPPIINSDPREAIEEPEPNGKEYVPPTETKAEDEDE